MIATGGTSMVLGVIALRVGERFATAVLTGLTGGTFALVLADTTSTAIDVLGRYAALRWAALLAANLIALVAFQDGFRARVGRSSSTEAPKALRMQRRDRRGRLS